MTMPGIARMISVIGALALAAPVAGCDGLDIFDKLHDLELLNTKKRVPGDRKPVFPEGVPGVTQGVPPELVKGYHPPAEPEPTPAPQTAAAAPARAATDDGGGQRNPHVDHTKPRPKRTAKRPPPADATVDDSEPPMRATPTRQARPPAAGNSPWPENPPPSRPPAQAANSPWPDPPPRQQPAASPWPDSPPPPAQPAASPWPSSPPAGTFSR